MLVACRILGSNERLGPLFRFHIGGSIGLAVDLFDRAGNTAGTFDTLLPWGG